MSTIGFTTTDLANLKAALVTGATRVKIGDREIEYNSIDNILRVIQMVQAELNGVATDVDDNPNVIQSTFSRGES